MAIDTQAKRTAMLAFRTRRRSLPWPTDNDLDSLSERLIARGRYGGFSTTVPSIGTSSGARQRMRRLGLVGRI